MLLNFVLPHVYSFDSRQCHPSPPPLSSSTGHSYPLNLSHKQLPDFQNTPCKSKLFELEDTLGHADFE
jgi:hypothetical protein